MTEVFKIIPAPNKAFFWLIGIFALLMVLILLLGYVAYSSRNVQFELSNTELHIKGDIYGRRIPLTSLIVNQGKTVELNRGSAYQPTWRTNGIGLPGYRSGWFKLRNGEKALLFVTEPRNVVYLPTTDGYSLLISVQKSEQFLRSLSSTQ